MIKIKEEKEIILPITIKDKDFNFVEVKQNILSRLFKKHDGYIIYINKVNKVKILKVYNFKTMYDLNKEKYILDQFFITYNNKPAFLLKYPVPISLEIDGDLNELTYNAESFYNYVNQVTMVNLTNFNTNNGIGDLISKNIVYILIGIALILALTVPDIRVVLVEFINNIGK